MTEQKQHSSDCSTNNEPAFPNGPCDCEASGFKPIRIEKQLRPADEMRVDYSPKALVDALKNKELYYHEHAVLVSNAAQTGNAPEVIRLMGYMPNERERAVQFIVDFDKELKGAQPRATPTTFSRFNFDMDTLTASAPALPQEHFDNMVRAAMEHDEEGITVGVLTHLFDLVGKENAAKGFHRRTELVLRYANRKDAYNEANEANADTLREHINELLMLVTSEAVEAHDELRNGHDYRQTYYPTEDAAIAALAEERHGFMPEQGTPEYDELLITIHNNGVLYKPEGFISEAVDIMIRMFDLFSRLGISREAAQMFVNKRAYNRSREFMHGGKKS